MRPGEVQAAPNLNLDQQVDSSNANALNINAATFGSFSANSTQQVYIDPLLLDLTGKGVGMTDFKSDPVLFDVDHKTLLKYS